MAVNLPSACQKMYIALILLICLSTFAARSPATGSLMVESATYGPIPVDFRGINMRHVVGPQPEHGSVGIADIKLGPKSRGVACPT